MPTYSIVEIFASLQGEGYNTGMPAVFIRFAGCNLRCSWCDTDFTRYQTLSLAAIVNEVRRYPVRSVIITGGEPTLQRHLPLLLQALKALGYFIAIESNGLRPIDAAIDYRAVSPKFAYWDKYRALSVRAVDEVRIVVDVDSMALYDFCLAMEQTFAAKRYYLAPCDQNGTWTMLATITLLGRLNQPRQETKWLLSIQTHKLAEIA